MKGVWGRLKQHLLPFALGVLIPVYLFYWAPSDLKDFTFTLANLPALVLFISPSHTIFIAAIVVNGLWYAAVAAAIRSTWRNRRWLSWVVITLVTLWVGGAFTTHLIGFRLQPFTEVVLRPGMTLSVRTPNGPLRITADRGTHRTFEGDGWKTAFSLKARESRYSGSLGLYSVWGPLQMEEGQQHVPTQAAAEAWLRGYKREADDGKNGLWYTSDGLALRYSVSQMPKRGPPTANIYLWQLYVNGRRPHGLPGAEDSLFHIEGGSVPESAMQHAR